MRAIHFYADLPRDWRTSAVYDAERHAHGRPGQRYIRVQSLADLELVLSDELARGRPLDAIDFHTHGSPGVAWIGADALSAATALRWGRRGLAALFAANATATLLGCSVGAGSSGRRLVEALGRALLWARGGTVLAHTGAGFADPLLTGNVYHPLGDWVRARVTPGGRVAFS